MHTLMHVASTQKFWIKAKQPADHAKILINLKSDSKTASLNNEERCFITYFWGKEHGECSNTVQHSWVSSNIISHHENRSKCLKISVRGYG